MRINREEAIKKLRRHCADNEQVLYTCHTQRALKKFGEHYITDRLSTLLQQGSLQELMESRGLLKDGERVGYRSAPPYDPVYQDTSVRVRPAVPKKKIKLNPKPADKNDPVYKDDSITVVRFKKPYRSKEKVTLPDDSITTVNIKKPHKPKERITLTVEEYRALDEKRKLILEELKEFNKLNNLAGHPILSDMDLAVYGASTMGRLESVQKSVRNATDYVKTLLENKK